MNAFNGLYVFEKTGTILAFNNNKESEDSEIDKAKPRVAETQRFESPDEQVF